MKSIRDWLGAKRKRKGAKAAESVQPESPVQRETTRLEQAEGSILRPAETQRQSLWTTRSGFVNGSPGIIEGFVDPDTGVFTEVIAEQVGYGALSPDDVRLLARWDRSRR